MAHSLAASGRPVDASVGAVQALCLVRARTTLLRIGCRGDTSP